MELIRGKTPRPQKIMLYGRHGTGKSTWASRAEGAGFVQTEDGLSFIDCVKTPLCRTTQEVMEGIELLNQQKEIRWIVIDTIDWLEKLIWNDLCQKHRWNSIADPGYGKGYAEASKWIEGILKILDGSVALGKNVILIGHAAAITVSPPGEDSYDRWSPDLHKHCAPTVMEWCDHILFVHKKALLKKEDAGFGRERTVARGETELVLKCNGSSTYEAKNRAGLPDEIPFDFDTFLSALKERV